MVHWKSPIIDLGTCMGSRLFIKREDLIPFSFGGNKARKAQLFFREIEEGGYDCVVTYGSGSSNHCRVVANECCRRGIRCCIVSPEGEEEPTFNRQMMRIFGASITQVPVSEVHDTIEAVCEQQAREGKKVFFIPGGGHGNTGTQAYADCYEEIREYEEKNDVWFDYVFLASGTGTTQAGLVSAQLKAGDERKIIGISIARKNPYGRNVVLDSIRDYLGEGASSEEIQKKTIFLDDYTGEGYGKGNPEICRLIDDVMKEHGIPLDVTYTGKAFYGMKKYLERNSAAGKHVLFLHTGGTPLFFDYLRERG